MPEFGKYTKLNWTDIKKLIQDNYGNGEIHLLNGFRLADIGSGWIVRLESKGKQSVRKQPKI